MRCLRWNEHLKGIQILSYLFYFKPIQEMSSKYVDFVSDEHLLYCIKNLHSSYIRAKANITKKKFYKNKIDTIKLTFDSKFNHQSEESVIETEILRQIDKSINNSIGTFHEQILGGISGFEIGNQDGFDIKATDNALFADIKNKHNTMNSSAAESLFQKLAHFADTYKGANCYWVQILAKKSFNKNWFGIINGKEYSHTRVHKISGDQFYALLTGNETSLFQLHKALPIAIQNFLDEKENNDSTSENSALSEIEQETEVSGRTMFDQITFENYSYYLGFDKL